MVQRGKGISSPNDFPVPRAHQGATSRIGKVGADTERVTPRG